MHTSLKHRTSGGFTIIELLIVIVVIGILAAILIVSYNGVQKGARDKSLVSDIDGVAGELTRYQTMHNGVYGPAVAWYSGNGANANIAFTPTPGDVIDVVTDQADYCIRAYNPASHNTTIATALTKGSSIAACDVLFASTAAGGPGGAIVGWWKLNGNAKDDSDNAVSGTVVNATPTTDMSGNANSAYSFDGTSSYISLGTNADYDYPTFSVSAWAKANGTPPHVRDIIGKGNWNTTNEWYLGFESGTATSFVYGLSAWNVGPSYPFTSYDVTQWTHYLATVSPTQEKLYINGALVSTVSLPHVSVTNTYDLQIGRASYAANFFSGSIDDVRLYNQELPASVVTSIFSHGPQ
jgi:prepilin-type N-terminal cleavage/methylation domain-containing protein